MTLITDIVSTNVHESRVSGIKEMTMLDPGDEIILTDPCFASHI